jgi:hypothetical protein
VRHRVGGGTGQRRQGRSLVARRSRKRHSSAGGGVRWRMQWREVGRAGGGDGRASDTGSIDRDGGGGGVRAGGAGLNGWAGRVGSDERCGVGRAGGWGARDVGVHLARLVGWIVGSR